MIISSCAHSLRWETVKGLKICSRVVAISIPFSPSPSTRPLLVSFVVCSLPMILIFLFFKILFRFRFAQAAGRPFSLSLSTNFQSQPSFKRLDQYVRPSFCRRRFRRSFGNCECCRTAIMARGSSVVFVFIWLCGTN